MTVDVDAMADGGQARRFRSGAGWEGLMAAFGRRDGPQASFRQGRGVPVRTSRSWHRRRRGTPPRSRACWSPGRAARPLPRAGADTGWPVPLTLTAGWRWRTATCRNPPAAGWRWTRSPTTWWPSSGSPPASGDVTAMPGTEPCRRRGCSGRPPPGGGVGALPVPLRARAVQVPLQPGGPGRQGGGLRQGSGGPPLPGRGRGRPPPGQSARRPERSLRLPRQGTGPQPAGQLPPGPADPAGGVRRSRPPVRPRSRMCHHGGPRSDSPGWPPTDGRCPILSNRKGMDGTRPDAVL